MSDDDLSRFGSDLPPRKEDILFRRRSIEKQRRDAFQGMEDWVYSTGFRLAAHHLAEQVGDTGTEQGFLIYPIIYLYRHYVELVLKATAVRLSGGWLRLTG
ncbi:MAG: hypothetical protein QOJ54_114 [Aliidongia sp.]|jgi:hypothetical protein|nr:hypothetical protein [Aliidongia sp.]